MKKLLLGITTLILFTGCATGGTRVTLLPEEGGKVGTITINDNKGIAHTINKPYTTLEIAQNGGIEDKVSDEKLINERYKDLITAMPEKLQNYYFFFGSGSATLNDDQKNELLEVSKTISKSIVHQVICIGHSDSTGTAETNEKVSKLRAQNVADVLIANGIKSELIELKYYGDANPLVKTKPNESNEKNRRVEIILK
ncbi:MAG: OmpA family protein [Arcobacteraceae bacterium]|nr:OmpA family protein [Arcobacteraceae bacterium]